MTFILSILIFSLAIFGVSVVLRKDNGEKNNTPGPDKNSPVKSSSIVSSISNVFSKRKDDFFKASKAVSKSRFAIVPLLTVNPVSKNFLGRKNILADIFSVIGKGPVLIGLYGNSGVGKTIFGGVVANNLLKKYGEEPIYVDMRGASANPASPDEVMTRVINLLRSSEKFPETEPKRTHLYKTLLQRRKVVLFLDNVPNSQVVKSLLPPNNCALIVTSQKPLSIPHMISKKLNPLDTADAQNLLLKTSPRTGFWVNEIASICSNFPQTLVLAGKYVTTYQNLDCGKFVDSLREGMKQVQSRPGDVTLKSLDVVLNISYRSLSEKAARVLRKLVLFPDTFDRKAAIFLCEDSDNEYLVNLLTLGLLSHNEKTGRFYFHHRVRRFLMARLNEGEQALAEKRFAAYFLTVMIAAGEFYSQGGKDGDQGLNLFDTEWENIKKGQGWAEKNSEQDNEADNLCLSYAEAGASLLGHRKSPADCLQWFQAALDSARRLNESEAEGKYLLLLGMNHIRSNEGDEAIDLLEKALKLAKQSEDKTTERKALGQLGLAHLALGKSHRAIEFLEKELELHKICGEPEGEILTLKTLGQTYFKVGEINQALEYYKRELMLAESRKDTKRQSRIFGDLGEIYISLKDHQSAIENFEKGMSLVKKSGDKKGEIILLGKLGEAHTEVEKFKNALSYFQQALALAQVLKDQNCVCAMMERMGHCHLKSGNHREALANYQKALVLYQKSGDKAREGETLWEMAQTTQLANKIPEAIQLAEQALVLYQKIKRLSGDTRETIETRLKEWEKMPGQEATVLKAVKKTAPEQEKETLG